MEKKYHTIEAIPKSNIKPQVRVKPIPLPHKYMTTYLAWYRHFNENLTHKYMTTALPGLV